MPKVTTKVLSKSEQRRGVSQRSVTSFLPDDYELPKSDSVFMDIQEGDNKIRVMSPAVFGWEGWKDGQPTRYPGVENPFTEDDVDFDERFKKPNYSHFWGFIVWNFADKKIQILQISQRGILKDLIKLVRSEDWGDPRNYSIVITKTVTKQRTEYKAQATPPKPISAEVLQAYKDSTIKLEQLFDNGEEEKETAKPKASKNKDEDVEE